MPMEALKLRNGDVFCHISAGGAGYGDPLARDPALVAEDVFQERFTRHYAKEVYGVVFADGTLDIDEVSTAKQRERLRAAQADDQPAYLRPAEMANADYGGPYSDALDTGPKARTLSKPNDIRPLS